MRESGDYFHSKLCVRACGKFDAKSHVLAPRYQCCPSTRPPLHVQAPRLKTLCMCAPCVLQVLGSDRMVSKQLSPRRLCVDGLFGWGIHDTDVGLGIRRPQKLRTPKYRPQLCPLL